MPPTPTELVLTSVALADGSRAHVRIADGVIAEVVDAGGPPPEAAPGGEVRDLDGWLLVASAVEPHAHLDKTLTAGVAPNLTNDLFGALDAWEQICEGFDPDDAHRRAVDGIVRAVRGGYTAVRTHVDLSPPLGLRPLEAVVAARAATAHLCDVEIAGLVLAPMTGDDGAAGRALVEAALDAGVDVVGGCPNLDPDPSPCVRELVAIAAANGRRIDLHVDETLDPSATTLQDLVREVVADGLEGTATASHAVSLGAQPVVLQRQVAAELASAGVGVVTLPMANLFLQARGQHVNPPRGVTAVTSLREAGVAVAAGGDNVQDPFNALGRSDPFETAALMVAVAHLSPEEAWESVTTTGRVVLGRPPVAVAVGSPADLLAVRARSVAEAIATAPADRLVLRAGVVVAETRTEAVVDPWAGLATDRRPGR